MTVSPPSCRRRLWVACRVECEGVASCSRIVGQRHIEDDGAQSLGRRDLRDVVAAEYEEDNLIGMRLVQCRSKLGHSQAKDAPRQPIVQDDTGATAPAPTSAFIADTRPPEIPPDPDEWRRRQAR